VFFLLLGAAARKFNWGFRDYYPPAPIVQDSFLYTLRLLQRYGSDWKDSAFYEDAFLRAFPRAIDEFESSPYWSAKETAARCFGLRALERFAAFCGLAELQIKSGRPFVLAEGFRVRKRPLLDAVVRFRV